MEISIKDLRQKEVINGVDGKRLGRICDTIIEYPAGLVCGFVVPGKSGFFKQKEDIFISLKNITKIGEDVILVNLCAPKNYGKIDEEDDE